MTKRNKAGAKRASAIRTKRINIAKATLEAPVAPAIESKPGGPIGAKPRTEPAQISEAIESNVEVTQMMDFSKIAEAPLASFTEAQNKARSAAEAGLNESRAKYTQFKAAADEAVGAMESSYASAKNGALEFNTRALEAMKEAAEANFDFAKSMFSVKSPSDFVALQTEFARKHYETMQQRSKAFGELAQKIATDSVEPIKAQMAKTFNFSN